MLSSRRASLIAASIVLLCTLHQSTSQSTCLVVMVDTDAIASGLDPSDWEGDYIYSGTQSSCPKYTSSDGQTLRYTPNSWILTAAGGGELAYETTDVGPPCIPPNVTAEWTHYSDVNTSTLSLHCISSYFPTTDPSVSPTLEPTILPTHHPTSIPSSLPSPDPTSEPTTAEPSSAPTMSPSDIPTGSPSSDPTMEPTLNPSKVPSESPTESPVTPAPTDECSRIELSVAGLDAVAQRVDGVYYQHALTTTNGYPYWTQHTAEYPTTTNSTNHVTIKFADGIWTITDAVGGVQLEDDSESAALIPPHDSAGDSWTESSGIGYTVTIECGAITDDPTATPTRRPTTDPTISPSRNPTASPTTSEPTEIPSSSPTQLTTLAPKEEELSTIAMVLDTFNVLEWAITGGVVFCCCFWLCVLCLWRRWCINNAERKHEEWERGVERAREQRRLEMTIQGPRRLLSETDGPSLGYHHAGSPRSDEFAAALIVVGSNKSPKSLYDTAVSGSDIERALNSHHPAEDIYGHTFTAEPLGMEWKTLGAGKKNLYVSKVAPGSQAEAGGVIVGSKLLSFNGQMIENLGAKRIYDLKQQAGLPLTITFLNLKPLQQHGLESAIHEEEKEQSIIYEDDGKGDQEDSNESSSSASTPEPPLASSIPDEAPPTDSRRALENINSSSLEPEVSVD